MQTGDSPRELPPCPNFPGIDSALSRIDDQLLDTPGAPTVRPGVVSELAPFAGETVIGPTADRIAVAAARGLGSPKSTRAVLLSMAHLTGRELRPDEARKLAVRLACNLHRLKAGFPALPWSDQSPGEWMACHVVHVRFARRRSRFNAGQIDTGFVVAARVVAGSYAPGVLELFWTRKFAAFAARQIGFTRRGPAYDDGTQLYGLRLAAYVEPSRDGTPRISRGGLACPAGLLAYNRKLIRKRARLDGFRCPFGYVFDCHRCVKGGNECEAATRRTTLALIDCTKCRKSGTLADPDPAYGGQGVCVHCRQGELV